MLMMKNTTQHEIRFPVPAPEKGMRHEIVFPAGATVVVADEERQKLEESRVASAWMDAGDLIDVVEAAPAKANLDSTGGAELDEKKGA